MSEKSFLLKEGRPGLYFANGNPYLMASHFKFKVLVKADNNDIKKIEIC